jgi:hypothetical protein
MVSFSDEEMEIVLALGAPLDPTARKAYLVDVGN